MFGFEPTTYWFLRLKSVKNSVRFDLMGSSQWATEAKSIATEGRWKNLETQTTSSVISPLRSGGNEI